MAGDEGHDEDVDGENMKNNGEINKKWHYK